MSRLKTPLLGADYDYTSISLPRIDLEGVQISYDLSIVAEAAKFDCVVAANYRITEWDISGDFDGTPFSVTYPITLPSNEKDLSLNIDTSPPTQVNASFPTSVTSGDFTVFFDFAPAIVLHQSGVRWGDGSYSLLVVQISTGLTIGTTLTGNPVSDCTLSVPQWLGIPHELIRPLYASAPAMAGSATIEPTASLEYSGIWDTDGTNLIQPKSA